MTHGHKRSLILTQVLSLCSSFSTRLRWTNIPQEVDLTSIARLTFFARDGWWLTQKFNKRYRPVACDTPALFCHQLAFLFFPLKKTSFPFQSFSILYLITKKDKTIISSFDMSNISNPIRLHQLIEWMVTVLIGNQCLPKADQYWYDYLVSDRFRPNEQANGHSWIQAGFFAAYLKCWNQRGKE